MNLSRHSLPKTLESKTFSTLPDVGERDPVAHVINRLTFGITPTLYDYVSRIGVDAFIEEQLEPEVIDDSECDELLEAFPLIHQSTAELAQRYQEDRRAVIAQFLGAWITRATRSRRQLYERMVHFWSDHFYIFAQGPAALLKIGDDRETIRPNVFGSFRDILGASAHSPAMLVFLDNAQSRGEHPNENYARELMELHTLGVDGGYTEDDVKAVARAFTGWSIVGFREANSGDETGTFRFRRRFHDSDIKTVLGHVLPAGRGIEDGEQVLDILAAHPSTARFIATKLVRRFVADQPPSALVDRCAATFTQSNGDTRAVLRTLFASEEFWNALPKFKRPFEYTISLLRALNYSLAGVEAQEFRPFLGALRAMGHVPFTWPAPNGFPDVGAYWMDNLLPRWNTAQLAVFGTGALQPNREALASLVEASAPASGDIYAALGHFFFGRDLTEAELNTIHELVADIDGSDLMKTFYGMALLLAAPAFQYA
jgi:uncharacterized protein (DUF1800 family)